MTSEMLKRLKETKRQPGGKLLAPGNYNYDILTQQNYTLAFNYFGIVDRDYDDEEKPSEIAAWQLSDQIQAVLNLDDKKSKPKSFSSSLEEGKKRIMNTGAGLLTKVKKEGKKASEQAIKKAHKHKKAKKS